MKPAASPDVALFAEQVRWLAARHLRHQPREAVLVWIAQRLDPGARAHWIRSWRIEHEAQLRAEAALIAVLRTSLTRRASEIRLVELPDRRVDWVASCLRPPLGTLRPPPPYVSRRSVTVADLPLRATLAAQAETWAAAIDVVADLCAEPARAARLRERSTALRRSAARHQGLGVPAATLDDRFVGRVRGLGDEGAALARALVEVGSFFGRDFGSDRGDEAALRVVAESLKNPHIANLNTLLEFSAALSIARAATEPSDGKDAWKLAPPSLARGAYPKLLLSRGPMRCEVAKGIPRHGGGQHVGDLTRPWVNNVLFSGEERAIGHQPDLVLRFWHEGAPHRSRFALGDAKRNEAGEGKAYLREALGGAALYLVAFAHALGLAVGGSLEPALRTHLSPAVTLFGWQHAGHDEAKAIALFGGPPEGMPSVIGLDLERHFAPRAGEPWRSPALTAWFRLLAGQAESQLAGANARRPEARAASAGAR